MRTVKVPLGNRSYLIRIGPGLLGRLGDECSRLKPGTRCAVISDRNVAPKFARAAQQTLARAGFDPVLITLPAGETAKSLASVQRCYDQLAAHRLERKSFIVALGGGVIGDLAGFVAATYHRGMPLVHVPTTLLAQVDSSIGGKVAVDHPLGKNLVGAFYSPRAVICDPTVLKSLSRRERWSGVAEVVKAALVADERFVDSLERDLDVIGNGLASEARMSEVVERAVRIKAAIVSEDERESGRRAILNFGHTLGHALEAVTGYGPLTHGEAIVIGMRVALEISAQLGHCSASDAARALALLSRFPAPPPLPRPPREAMIAAARRDKKARAGAVKFVVLTGIGKAEIEHGISDELLGLAVDRALDEFSDGPR